MKMNKDIKDKLIQLDFPETEFVKATYPKRQIVLHHTVSNGTAQAVADYWTSKEDKIGTCIIIDKQGKMNQLFSSTYYAGHVGNVAREMKAFSLPYRSCSTTSIGVEIISLGALLSVGDKLVDTYGKEYKGDFVFYKTPYRGYNYYAKYNEKQIETLKQLLLYWCDRYNIPTTYREDMWEVNRSALNGTAGIYSHTSFRYGKSDLHPQKELIAMLKTL